MAKAGRVSTQRSANGYAKRMSDNIAMALVIYTMMLIFVVTPSIETKGTSILPYFLLVVFVASIIPFFRRFEHRWVALDGSELGMHGLDTRFSIDRVKLWVMAIGVPLLLALMFRAFAAIF